uniref:Uncharacterized protein n=1 Tax=Meloidogyne enterolobii TaxID=390850 RepID=A0A6V7WN09_MELEN|nr:unnamed protein product [Meloidogyne enterolobii]
MRTPKQFEEWLNSDNIKDDLNKIGDETLVEEDKNFTEKSILETTSVDGLSTTCTSCCLSKNIIEGLKQRLKELELKLKNNDLTLENCSLKFQNKIQKINSERENEIKNLKQYFQQLIEENNKQLKAENDAYLKQKDEKINLLEEEIKNKIQKINCDNKNEIEEIKQNFQKLIEENVKELKDENVRKDEKINSLKVEIKKLHTQSDDLIKLQTNFKDLQLKFNEEKEKTENLEDELKKIQTINEEKIEEIKNNFQKLKDENVRKNEKINSLEFEIKKANDLTDKKFDGLFELNNLNSVVSLLNNMVFVKIKNKWKEIDSGYSKCCDKNCINTNKPIGNCIEGNGFVNLINDENIKYLVGNGGYDQNVEVYAENPFKKPQNSFNYSLYYFEVKCKFEKELNGSESHMTIGLRNCSTTNYIYYSAKYGTIYNERSFQLPTLSWNNNDIFGCGLVYPPTNMSNEFPYVFFTQNGKQIGKGVLLNDNFDSYKPHVWLNCCSIEANFGNDLESKPFEYDISKHLNKEFY